MSGGIDITRARAERPTRILLGDIHQLSTDAPIDFRVNPSPRLINNYTLIFVLAASVTSVLLGYEIGALSETIDTIKKDQELLDRHAEILTVVLHIVALLASWLAGHMSDRFGRRYTILGVGVIFFVAPFLMGFASSYLSVMCGRVIAHIGVGFTLAVAPVYVAEICPVSFRGSFTALPEVFVNGGILLGYSCTYLFFKLKLNGWLVMAWEGAISLVLLTMAVLILPESPQWLILRGRVDEGLSVLAMTSDSEEEAKRRYTHIVEAVGIRQGSRGGVVNVQNSEREVCRELRHPSPPVKHMLVCAITIQLFRQFCGVDTILLYVPDILEEAGITASKKKLLWTIRLDVLKMIFTVVAAFVLDKLGRRRLVVGSTCGMMVSLFTLGACLTKIDRSNEEQMWASRICIASLFGYVASFSIGLGPITSVYNSEIFPLRLRAQGCAIAFAANQGASALTSLAVLLLNEVVTLGGAAFFFAAVALVASVVFFLIMPETKGVALEEMSPFFSEIFKWGRDIEMPRPDAGKIEMQTTVGRRN